MIGDPNMTEEWVHNIGAITLFTEDLASTRQFYVDVFAMIPVFSDDVSVVFELDGVLINLLSMDAVPGFIRPAVAAAPDAHRFVLTIHVEDVDEVCARLKSLGVALLNGPIDRPWGPRTASFVDPAGHIWAVAGPPATAA